MIPEYVKIEAKKELARRNYLDYVEYVHDGRWIRAKHLVYICNEIQTFIETPSTNAIDILILEMPPQHGKSMSTTETLPSWYLGKYPTRRVIQASYNENTAERFCRRNKEKIKQYGNELFGIKIGELDRATDFELDNNVGSMISRGIMSGITSNAADLIIIDDPIKNRMEADSETFRDRLWEEWQNTIKTRLSAGAKVIVIMTRWHEDDLAGRIIQGENSVKEIRLPIEAEEDDVIGRTKGQALFPEIGKDDVWLKDFKDSYIKTDGSRAWNALYQCRPSTEQGNIVKREWIKQYDILPIKNDFRVVSVDATFKDESTSDFVAIQVWDKIGTNYYLAYRLKQRMGFIDTLKKLDELIPYYKPNATLIEDKANGSAIIEVLRKKYSNVIALNPEGGKIARLEAVSPIFESGNVYIPRNSEDYIEEVIKFPYAAHDDEVDSSSQALNYMRTKTKPNDLTEQDIYKQRQYNDTKDTIAGNLTDYELRDLINF